MFQVHVLRVLSSCMLGLAPFVLSHRAGWVHARRAASSQHSLCMPPSTADTRKPPTPMYMPARMPETIRLLTLSLDFFTPTYKRNRAGACYGISIPQRARLGGVLRNANNPETHLDEVGIVLGGSVEAGNGLRHVHVDGLAVVDTCDGMRGHASRGTAKVQAQTGSKTAPAAWRHGETSSCRFSHSWGPSAGLPSPQWQPKSPRFNGAQQIARWMR